MSEALQTTPSCACSRGPTPGCRAPSRFLDLSSALCGLAPSLPVLIAFRVAQGIGAALLSSNSVAIVVTAAGPAQRGSALGVLSAAQAVGLSAGPALGGLVLDLLDWRWVFWINVPVGLAG